MDLQYETLTLIPAYKTVLLIEKWNKDLSTTSLSEFPKERIRESKKQPSLFSIPLRPPQRSIRRRVDMGPEKIFFGRFSGSRHERPTVVKYLRRYIHRRYDHVQRFLPVPEIPRRSHSRERLHHPTRISFTTAAAVIRSNAGRSVTRQLRHSDVYTARYQAQRTGLTMLNTRKGSES
jgi:hypothetical protein